MTFVSHAYVGAVSAILLSRAVGVEQAGLAIPLVGSALGSAPDTVDWVGAKLGCWPRWWMYNIMHHYRPVMIVEYLMVIPGVHLLFDLLVHKPVEESDDPTVGEPLFKVFGLNITRGDVHWIVAEVMMDSLATNALLLLR